MLYFLIFWITYNLLNYYDKYFLYVILKTILILFFISAVQVFFQLIDLKEISHKYLYEISGISGHKNLYSSFIFLCSIFSFFSLLQLNRIWKLVSVFSIVLQIILIAILQTRTVWIAYIIFIITILLILLLRKKMKSLNYMTTILYIIVTILLINISLLFVLPKYLNNYKKDVPTAYNQDKISDLGTLSERFYIWKNTYDIINKNRWIGVGANNWQIYFPSPSLPDIYPVQDLNVTYQRPHNDFLWILSEYGILGFNILLIFTTSILFLLFYRIINFADISCIILLSGILSFLCISFFDFPKERIEHNILYGILLGISVYYIKKDNKLLNTNLFHISKFMLSGFIIVLIPIVYFSVQNFKGEYYTKIMYYERMKKNNDNVILLCDVATSKYYTIDPTSVPLNWYKGNANANLGNYSQALNDFRLALKSHPFNHHILNDLGSAFFMNNKIDSAIICFKEAVRINPRFDDPKLNLTVIYINIGNYSEAELWNESILHDSERRNYYRQIINETKTDTSF
ncbi:MAG: O-antigen ligase family protein [Bacteroidota bacterium]